MQPPASVAAAIYGLPCFSSHPKSNFWVVSRQDLLKNFICRTYATTNTATSAPRCPSVVGGTALDASALVVGHRFLSSAMPSSDNSDWPTNSLTYAAYAVFLCDERPFHYMFVVMFILFPGLGIELGLVDVLGISH